MAEGAEAAKSVYGQTEVTMLLQSIENKTTEIIDLKTKLNTAQMEIASLQRGQAAGISASVGSND